LEGVRLVTCGPDPSCRLRIACVIADNDRLFATVLARRLGNHEEFEVVGFAQDGDEAVALGRDLKAGLILIDCALSPVGIDATRRLRELPDPPAVVMLTSAEFKSHRLHEGNVVAYVRKSEVMSLIDVVAGVSRLLGAGVAGWDASQN
jgi:DNA-binding NarL/FixJ family response regulator